MNLSLLSSQSGLRKNDEELVNHGWFNHLQLTLLTLLERKNSSPGQPGLRCLHAYFTSFESLNNLSWFIIETPWGLSLSEINQPIIYDELETGARSRDCSIISPYNLTRICSLYAELSVISSENVRLFLRDSSWGWKWRKLPQQNIHGKLSFVSLSLFFKRESSDFHSICNFLSTPLLLFFGQPVSIRCFDYCCSWSMHPLNYHSGFFIFSFSFSKLFSLIFRGSQFISIVKKPSTTRHLISSLGFTN